MLISKSLVFGALVAALAVPAHAIDVAPDASGAWTQFKVDELESLSYGVEWIDNNDTLAPQHGTPLSFVFDIAQGSFGTLTVVDGGFAGDSFTLTNFGALFGATSAVASTGIETAAPGMTSTAPSQMRASAAAPSRSAPAATASAARSASRCCSMGRR